MPFDTAFRTTTSGSESSSRRAQPKDSQEYLTEALGVRRMPIKQPWAQADILLCMGMSQSVQGSEFGV